MTRIYIQQPLAVGASIELPDEAVRHLVQVLRMAAGETLTAFNGEGGEYACTLTAVARRSATMAINSFDAVSREAPLAVTIAQCVSKGDRMDYALQKATELGAAAFIPVLSSHGVVKLDGERWEKKVEHWRGVVISAAEQSGRTRVPTVGTPIAFDALLTQPQKGTQLILAPEAGLQLGELPRPESITALIGPEGGFSDSELQLAERKGWQRLGLGPRVLRTETAPVALLAALQARFGDFG